MRAASLSLILFVEALLVGLVFSQGGCDKLAIENLGVVGSVSSGTTFSTSGLVAAIISPGGDGSSGAETIVIEDSFLIVCEAQHEMQDKYRSTSALFSYVCTTAGSSLPNCDGSTVITEQITLGCMNGTWDRRVFNNDNQVLRSDPLATSSTMPVTSCSFCIPPDNTATNSLNMSYTYSPVTHCVACAGCNVGLGSCYVPAGALSSDQICCNFFEKGVCVANCSEGLQPGTNFVCGCQPLNDDNGMFLYSNYQAIGSVATLACNAGYETNILPATCDENAQWTTNQFCKIALCPLLPDITLRDVLYSNTERVPGTVATISCDIRFLLDPEIGNMRTCETGGTWSGVSSTCKSCSEEFSNCKECKYVDGVAVCTDCEDGFEFDDSECKTSIIDSKASSSCDVPCIIGIVLAILAVIIITTVVIVVAFVLYKYLNDPATKLAKADAEGLNGVARDNPLYLDPSAVTDDGIDGVENGVTETTPLDS